MIRDRKMIKFENPSIHRVAKITISSARACNDFSYRIITFENSYGETAEMVAYTEDGAPPIILVCDGELK